MTAAELLEHPEYPYVTWDLKPQKKGKAAVAKGRGGPFNIAYEVHGHGPTKLVVGIPTRSCIEFLVFYYINISSLV